MPLDVHRMGIFDDNPLLGVPNGLLPTRGRLQTDWHQTAPPSGRRPSLPKLHADVPKVLRSRTPGGAHARSVVTKWSSSGPIAT